MLRTALAVVARSNRRGGSQRLTQANQREWKYPKVQHQRLARRELNLGCQYNGSTIMPALCPITLTATQIVFVADPVPKFDLERACRGVAAAGLPGRDSAACQRDEQAHAANSRKTGANIAQQSERSAMALSQPVAQQVMWNC